MWQEITWEASPNLNGADNCTAAFVDIFLFMASLIWSRSETQVFLSHKVKIKILISISVKMCPYTQLRTGTLFPPSCCPLPKNGILAPDVSRAVLQHSHHSFSLPPRHTWHTLPPKYIHYRQWLVSSPLSAIPTLNSLPSAGDLVAGSWGTEQGTLCWSPSITLMSHSLAPVPGEDSSHSNMGLIIWAEH